MHSRILIASAALVVACIAANASAAESKVRIGNAWARATAPGQKTAAVYFDVTSETDAALVGARSPAAERAELHSMTNDGGVMRMRPLERIDLPAGKTVVLGPTGSHVMLVNIRRPLKAGEGVPLTLTVQAKDGSRSSVDTRAGVRALTASHEHMKMH